MHIGNHSFCVAAAAYTIHRQPAEYRTGGYKQGAENTRAALFLDSQLVLTLGCAALRFRGCVIGGHGRLAQQPSMSRVSCDHSLAALVASSCSSPPPTPVQHFIKLKLCPRVQTTEVTGGWTQSFSFLTYLFSIVRRKFYGSYNDCYVVCGLCWQQCLCTLAMVNVLY